MLYQNVIFLAIMKQHNNLYLFLQFILSLESISLSYSIKNENGISLCCLPDTSVCVKLTKMEILLLKSRFDLILSTKYHDSTKLFIYYDFVLSTICNPRLTTLCYYPLLPHGSIETTSFVSELSDYWSGN
jgi:hypothetical protein